MTTSRPPEDLTQIDGIGPARARKLADLGIHRFRDLANGDPDTLAEQLKGVSADAVRGWVSEAAGRAVGKRARTPSDSAAASAPSSARTHRTFTIDVQRETASGKIVGAVVTDTASGDNLPTALDASKIMAFINERLETDIAPLPGGSTPSPTAPEGLLQISTIPELILEAPHGFGVAVVVPSGHGEARLWVSQRALSGAPATTVGHMTCELDPTSSLSATVTCAPLLRSTSPYRLEFVADLRLAPGTGDAAAASPAISVALLPDPSVHTVAGPVEEDAGLDYWRQRSLSG